jgi:alpha-glucosidase
MFPLQRLRFVAAMFFTIAASTGTGQEIAPIRSPDGRIEVRLNAPIADSENVPTWSASFKGAEVLKGCELGLKLKADGELLAGARIEGETRHSVDQRIPVLFGKADHANDRYNEIRLTLQRAGQRQVFVILRCYDDAIAFRYELPGNASEPAAEIVDENSSFRIHGAKTAYIQQLEHYQTSHEHNVAAVDADQIPRDVLLDLPLTFQWPDGTYAAITEASLRKYAGMSLMRMPSAAAPDRLVCKLTPRPDGIKVKRPFPLQTPWRAVLLGDRPGALLESLTIYSLNDAYTIGDTSWIHPGKITFSWWNGDVYDGARSGPILSFEMAKKYIDFCARNGIPTHSLTSTEPPTTPWYQQSKRSVEPGPDTDVTKPREGFDLPRIREYAELKNVKLWTWVHQAALRGRVEEAFAAFEKQGWSGMMVDFFDHDDQDTVEWAEEIVQAAARHHIMVQLHGIWKPTGWERTYPHVVNHEGALNLEYLKWSDRCTPDHNLKLAFTRLIAGPMDYHLGGFRAVPRASFKPHDVAPNVLGTRCHMLAMYICFDNPNPMLADYPAAYEGQPGFDFLRAVPTWWDETRVLQADVGELLVTARRKGSTWYLGAISANRRRNLEIPLTFAGKGTYKARIWKDAPDSGEDPNRLVTTTEEVNENTHLKLDLSTDGGFVAELTPAAAPSPQ